MKIAQIQMPVLSDKMKSFDSIKRTIEKSVPKGVDLIALAEMFTTPYQVDQFPLYAEVEGGSIWQMCSNLATENHCYLSAGTVAEKDEAGNIYNTAYVFDRSGKQIAKHRKMHLFDIQIKGGQHFKESETLTAGNKITTFETEFGVMGLCICYDFRFPELGRLMALKGAKIILVPAAFNMSTGPDHWQLMFKSQALNNQVFAIGTAPARDASASYQSWAHSLVVDPWGRIVNQLGEKPNVLITEIDLDLVEEIREQLPLLKHRRSDVYKLEEIKN
jgi:predicted amidohydrolase